MEAAWRFGRPSCWYDLDMAKVVAISIDVNHEEITIEGEYQTAEERRALVEEAMAKRDKGVQRFKTLTPPR